MTLKIAIPALLFSIASLDMSAILLKFIISHLFFQ